MHITLLPQNRTPWEETNSEVNSPQRTLGVGFEDIYAARVVRPAQFLPATIWQYGLGELTPYVPSLNQLIDEGIDWQRVRGTPAAIAKALGWVGYAGTLREAPIRRIRWNRFQIGLDRVRDFDRPDLERIYGVVSLSPPIRSRFTRGWSGYDVPAAEGSRTKWSRSIWSSDSGTRIDQIPAKWSFGRPWESDKTLTQAELEALGAWVPPVGTDALWVNANYLWATANFAWAQPAAVARRNAIAETLISLGTPFIRFRDENGAVIGNVRAVAWKVAQATPGAYRLGNTQYGVTTTGTEGLIVAARTGWGDGAGRVAASMSVVFGAGLLANQPPGTLWAAPPSARLSTQTIPSATLSFVRTGLAGGIEVAATAVNIPFGLTVRERPIFLLRF